MKLNDNMSSESCLSTLESLASLDLSKCCPNEVHCLVDSLFPQYWLCHPLKEGTIISRCRKEPPNLKKESFSYKEASMVHNFERASIPYSSVFYGAVGDDNPEYGDFIAMLETSQIRRENKDSGREKICVSRWQVKKELKMALVVHNDVFVDGLTMGNSLNSMQQNYLKLLSEYPVSSEVEILDKKVKFFATEFAKEVITGQDRQYMISAYFSDNVMNGNSDGIIYPSVQGKGQLGFNVAIKPSTVDNSLEFLSASEYELFKNGDYMPVKVGKYSDTEIQNFLEIDDISQLQQF